MTSMHSHLTKMLDTEDAMYTAASIAAQKEYCTTGYLHVLIHLCKHSCAAQATSANYGARQIASAYVARRHMHDKHA